MTPEHPERRAYDWLYEEVKALRLEHRDAHQRLRSDMHAEFAQLHDEVLNGLKNRVDDNAARILVIETERKLEEKQAVKRGAWAGLLAGSGISILWEVLKAKWFR